MGEAVRRTVWERENCFRRPHRFGFQAAWTRPAGLFGYHARALTSAVLKPPWGIPVVTLPRVSCHAQQISSPSHLSWS